MGMMILASVGAKLMAMRLFRLASGELVTYLGKQGYKKAELYTTTWGTGKIDDASLNNHATRFHRGSLDLHWCVTGEHYEPFYGCGSCPQDNKWWQCARSH